MTSPDWSGHKLNKLLPKYENKTKKSCDKENNPAKTSTSKDAALSTAVTKTRNYDVSTMDNTHIRKQLFNDDLGKTTYCEKYKINRCMNQSASFDDETRWVVDKLWTQDDLVSKLLLMSETHRNYTSPDKDKFLER